MKKFLCILIYLALAFSVMPADVIAASGGGSSDYYRAVSGMVRSHWRDDYFLKATLKPKDSTIKIDNRTIKLKNKVSVEQDELMIPAEALEALGVQVEQDAKGFRARKNGRLVEVTYGDKGMRVNGRKKSMRSAPGLKNGAPVVPESVLSEDGLGFEVDMSSDEVVITNSFQTMRVLTKVRSGMSLPADIQTEQTIAGPDGLYILQFSTADAAKTACETLNASSNILYAEPDGIVLLDEAIPEAVIYNMEVAEAEPNEEIPAEAVMYNMEMAEAEPNEVTPTDAAPTDAAPAEAEIQPKASYAHLGWGPERIGSDAYMDYLIGSGKQNASVKVAVLDTGLDTGHSYFAGRQVSGYNMVDGNTSMSDAHGHGTHVSGTVIDVTIGMPNVKIMPVKVLDQDGYGSNIQIANGVYWAADNGAQVINMSLGGSKNYTVDSAVRYAVGRNATVVVAAGNSVSNTKYFSPASEESAITVAALGQDENTASFSNYGSAVDVAAPGVGIVSARTGGGTTSMDGTSMACPHVAGAAALLLCDNPGLAPSAVESKIRATAEDRGTPGFDTHYGYGVLNIGNAADLSDVFLTANLSTDSEYLDLHQTVQIHATYSKNGTVSDVTALARYTSSDAAVAAVAEGGILTTGSVSGVAVITVAYQGTLVELPVDVGPMLTGLTVSPDAPVDLAIGEQKEMTVTAHYSDGSQKMVKPKTWSFILIWNKNDEAHWPPWQLEYTSIGLVVHGVHVGKGTIMPIYEERGVKLTAIGVYCTVGEEMLDHIVISPESMDLTIGNRAKIEKITVVCKDGSSFYLGADEPINYVSSDTIKIKTSNPDIAAVNKVDPVYVTFMDDIFATGAGTATITVDFMGKEATMDVTVNGLYKSISLAGLPNNLEVGAAMQPCVYVTKPDGSVHNPLGVTWESSDPSVAEAIQTGGSQSYFGRIIGVSPGTATITARLPGGLTASGDVTVGHCQSVHISQAAMTIEPDQEADIYLRGQFEDGSEALPGGVTWTSSDPTVADVSELWFGGYPWPDTGWITGVLPGTATITARTAGGLEAACVVTVGENSSTTMPTGVTVSPRTVTLDQGGTLPLTATVSPHNVADKTVTWSSDNTAVATVSADGLVTAVAPGTAIITAQTANGITDTCAATVLDTVVPDSITISPAEALIVQGFQRQLKPIFSPAGVTDRTILWSSDNESVATVSAFGLVKTVAPGTATITARTYNGKTATCAVRVFIPVNGVTLHIVSMTLYAGQSWTLPVTVYPEDASDKRLTWASSDEAVATVSGGVVTALKAGTATISATAADGSGKSATCQITVNPDVKVEGVALDKTNETLYTGETLTLNATVLPADANDKRLTWASSDDAVATVNGGVVSALKAGTATITATAADGSGKSATCEITVWVPAASVTVGPVTAAMLKPGATLTLTANVLPANAHDRGVTWSTNNSGVARVDGGTVTAVARGQATITATTHNGKTGVCLVTVEDRLNGLLLSVPNGTPMTEGGYDVPAGATLPITAKVYPEGIGYTISFTSTNTSVATVSQAGVVKGVKTGQATITAIASDTSGSGRRAAATVKINVIVPVSKVTLPAEAPVLTGTTKKLTAALSPASATYKALTWASDNETVATVAQDGTVTAKKAGTANIKATAHNGQAASCLVRVTDPATGVQITTHTGKAYMIYKGSLQLTATVNPGTANKAITWKSSNTAYVTVDANGKAYGKKVGKATVYAATADGSGVRGSIEIQVITPLKAMSLPEADKVFVGKTKKLTIKLTPASPTFKTLTWTSNNEDVATVAADGTVTAKALGTAVITATSYNDLNDSCTVTVAQPVEKIGFKVENTLIYKGESVRLSADISPEIASDKSLTWKSSNTKVATVDAQGLVTGKGAGKVKITATAKDGSGVSGSISLTIVVPQRRSS